MMVTVSMDLASPLSLSTAVTTDSVASAVTVTANSAVTATARATVANSVVTANLEAVANSDTVRAITANSAKVSPSATEKLSLLSTRSTTEKKGLATKQSCVHKKDVIKLVLLQKFKLFKLFSYEILNLISTDYYK